MSVELNKTVIREFLSSVFRRQEFGDDDDIFELGFVNSLFAMELVLFIEKEFSITIDNEDLDIKNFSKINAIAALIERKTEGSGNAPTREGP